MSYIAAALETQHAAREHIGEMVRKFSQPGLLAIARRQAGLHLSEVQQWRTDHILLGRASAFYWNERTTKLVMQASQDFDLTQITSTRNLLYCDYGWHYFAETSPMLIQLRDIKSLDGYYLSPLRAILWYWFDNKNTALGATAFCEENGKLHPALWVCVDAGKPMSDLSSDTADFVGIHDDRTKAEMQQIKQLVCCMSTFVRQEILHAEPAEVERHARKRLAKQGVTKPGTVSEIQLRRVSRPKTEPATDAEPTHREFNWQWTVRGHTRQQWYATLGEHLPVYISPYLKGPEDKPLKPRTTPIYSVTR